MVFKICVILALCCVVSLQATTLQIGNSVNGELAYSEVVTLSSFPFKVRTKTVSYNDEKNRPIKGIWAIDRNESKAKVIVNAGGVGFTFVTIRLKSEKGEGLNYQVQVFV